MDNPNPSVHPVLREVEAQLHGATEMVKVEYASVEPAAVAEAHKLIADVEPLVERLRTLVAAAGGHVLSGIEHPPAAVEASVAGLNDRLDHYAHEFAALATGLRHAL